MVADLDAGHALADFLDDTAAFVAEDHREQAFRIGTGQRERIGVANAGGDDAHQHLARPWGPQTLTLLDRQRLARSQGDSSLWTSCRPASVSLVVGARDSACICSPYAISWGRTIRFQFRPLKKTPDAALKLPGNGRVGPATCL